MPLSEAKEVLGELQAKIGKKATMSALARALLDGHPKVPKECTPSAYEEHLGKDELALILSSEW